MQYQELFFNDLSLWLWLVVNDRKFTAETIFFSHTNQPAVLLHEPATKRTSQPNRLLRYGGVVPQLVSFIYSEFSVVVMFFIYTIQEEG